MSSEKNEPHSYVCDKCRRAAFALQTESRGVKIYGPPVGWMYVGSGRPRDYVCDGCIDDARDMGAYRDLVRRRERRRIEIMNEAAARRET